MTSTDALIPQHVVSPSGEMYAIPAPTLPPTDFGPLTQIQRAPALYSHLRETHSVLSSIYTWTHGIRVQVHYAVRV